mgnify:CR=1 FL=1
MTIGGIQVNNMHNNTIEADKIKLPLCSEASFCAHCEHSPFASLRENAAVKP